MLECYDNYLGSLEVADRQVVHLGFGLLMAGVMLLVVGWAIYLWSETAAATMMAMTNAPLYTLRKAAITAAGIGLPLVFTGGVTLLLADRRVSKGRLRKAEYAGVACCLVAVGLFLYSYPNAWNVTGTDYSLPAVTVYGIGLAMLMMTTGAGIGCRCSVSARPAD